MLANYFRTIVRALFNNKLYSLINLVGLTLGITSCLLIFLYISDETSYDKHHQHAERIFRITTQVASNGSTMHAAYAPALMAPVLKEEFPEVREAVRLLPHSDKAVLRYGTRQFNEKNIWFADPTVFDVFSYAFVRGNPAKALESPGSIVVTESLVARYFGNEDPIGKVLRVDNEEYEVTAILKDLPANSDVYFEALLPGDEEVFDDWSFTYLLLGGQDKAPQLVTKLNRLARTDGAHLFGEAGGEMKVAFEAEALADVHFSSGKLYDTPKGNRSYIYIFTVVSVFILVIASINYVNISVGVFSRRFKEIGVRKVLGATKAQLVKQFTLESVLQCLAAIAGAVVLALLLLPLLNQLSNKSLTFGSLLQWNVLLVILGIFAVIGVVAGSYPAFYVSSFEPVKIIKNKLPRLGKQQLMTGLVVSQFAISLVLTMCTLVVFKQMVYLRDYKLGFKKEQVLIVDIPRMPDGDQAASVLQEQLAGVTGVNQVSLGGYGSEPGTERSRDAITLGSDAGGTEKILDNIFVDEQYLELLGISLVAGRNFRNQDADGTTREVIVNEELLKAAGWDKNPAAALGKPLQSPDGLSGQIVGVVKNFHIGSLHNKIPPLLLVQGVDHPSKVFVSIRTENIKSNIEAIGAVWKEAIPDQAFSYSFLDANYNRLYQNEEKMFSVYSYFTAITLVIVCMGLFGLSALTTRSRIKEVSVRKVFGARMSTIVYLLTRKLLIQVAVAFVLAAPLSLYLMQAWLNHFAYHTEIGWFVFVLAGLVALAVVLATISYHTFKAARTNPIDALKYE